MVRAACIIHQYTRYSMVHKLDAACVAHAMPTEERNATGYLCSSCSSEWLARPDPACSNHTVCGVTLHPFNAQDIQAQQILPLSHAHTAGAESPGAAGTTSCTSTLIETTGVCSAARTSSWAFCACMRAVYCLPALLPLATCSCHAAAPLAGCAHTHATCAEHIIMDSSQHAHLLELHGNTFLQAQLPTFHVTSPLPVICGAFGPGSILLRGVCTTTTMFDAADVHASRSRCALCTRTMLVPDG